MLKRCRAKLERLSQGICTLGMIVACSLSLSDTVQAQSTPWRNWGNSPEHILNVERGADWRSHADRPDQDRINNLNDAWDQSLASARQDGHDGEIRAEGALLDPRAGKPGAHPPSGIYRCRTFTLGALQPGLLSFVSYPAFRCRLWENSGVTYFEKITGSQRSAGVVFRDSSIRSVMISTQAWGDEKGFPRYSEDDDRNQIAVVEKIGDGRWRLVFPFPKQESLTACAVHRAGSEADQSGAC